MIRGDKTMAVEALYYYVIQVYWPEVASCSNLVCYLTACSVIILFPAIIFSI